MLLRLQNDVLYYTTERMTVHRVRTVIISNLNQCMALYCLVLKDIVRTRALFKTTSNR